MFSTPSAHRGSGGDDCAGVPLSPPSCAATVLDSESDDGAGQMNDDGGQSLVIVISDDDEQELQGDLRPLHGLQMRINEARCEQVDFTLGPSPGREPLQDVQARVREVVDTNLSQYACFKIGITYRPHQRWVDPRYGYKHKGYARMVFCFATDRSDDVVTLEKSLIAHLKSDGRCLNKAHGGESAHHGFSPFFLYVAFSRHAL